ncbi:MAG: hypothetical protein ACREV1_00880 [Gammaproteobacteria bacterium]
MLLLDSALEVAGISLLRDHLLPRTFYYLPGAPRLVSQADHAGITLLRYRGEEAGGLLFLDIYCALAQATLDQARETLAQRYGGTVDLVPVLFDAGRVRLIVLGVESSRPAGGEDPATLHLVEQILCTATPSLLGQQRAIFSVELNREGAALVAAALRTKQVPLLVVYELSFSGLHPARGLRARVSYRMAYDYLRTRFAANALMFRTDLDREAEALQRQGLITIEDVDYLGSDPVVLKQRAETIRSTLRELADTLFFRPAAAPVALGAEAVARNPAIGNAWAGSGHAFGAFVLREFQQDEEAELSYDLSETALGTARVAPQAPLALPQGIDPDTVIREVDLDWPPAAAEVRAFSLADADWSGVQAIQIDLRRGDELRALVLSPEQHEQSAVLPRGGIEYRIKARVEAEPEALGTPPEAEPDFRPLESLNLFIDPATLARRRLVSIVLGAFDPNALTAVQGELRAGDRAQAFLLDGARPTARIPVWGSPPLTLEATLATAAGDSLGLASQSLGPAQTLVVLNQPLKLYHMVLVTLQDPLDRYGSALVELEGLRGETRRVLRLDATNPSERWSVAHNAQSAFSFRYRTRMVLQNASVLEDDWREATGSLLIVGDLDVRVEPIEVVLLGAESVLGALLTFTSLAPPTGVTGSLELLLNPGQTQLRIKLPFQREAARRYRVAGQVFLADGELLINPREETAEVLILSVSGSP